MALHEAFAAALAEEEARPAGDPRPLLLLVDDETEILASLTEELRRDYRVVTATRGREALEILRTTEVSVVVSDQRMPEMTGAEFLASASVLQEDAVRILLTGYSDLESVVRAVNDGKIFFYLSKPWKPVELRSVIGMASEHGRLARERRSLLSSLKSANAELEARVAARTAELAERAAQLEEATAAARAANEAKSAFLAAMSHEIRTPMNGVLGMARLLAETPLAPAQREYLGIINGSAESLLAIIDEILDFSRIEAGRIELESVDVDLGTLLDDVFDLLAPRAAEKGLDFECVVEPDVPLLLRGDRVRLRQVVTNLLGNALKFTLKGEVALFVSLVRREGSSARLRLCVRDTGVGVRADRIASLFTPFTQGDASTTRRFGGTGLGLSISRRLVERMGGEIGVESREGEGSTFWFEVPLPLGLGALPVPADPPPGPGFPVLVADPSPLRRRAVVSRLDRWGCRSEQAGSAAEALEALRSSLRAGRPFAVVLAGAGLAGTGAGLADALREEPGLAGTRVLLLAGPGSPPPEAAGTVPGAGAPSLLQTPCRSSRLLPALRSVEAASVVPRPPGEAGVPAAAPPAPADRPVRILLAEDNRVNQIVALKILGRLGYSADVAADGLEALVALRARPYDIVFMDVQMPTIDGLQATRMIRSGTSGVLNPKVPIVAMTAHAMKGDRDQCLASGMDGFISKPVEPTALANAIEGWARPSPPPADADAEGRAGGA